MKILIALILTFVFVLPVSAQVSTPQPPPLPTQEMYQALATQNANIINTMPSSLQNPNGTGLLPNQNGSQLFGYIKWLINPAMADEWAGPFSPAFQHFGIGLYMIFAMSGIYMVAYTVNNIGSWVFWLAEQARKFLDLVMQILQAGPIVIVVGIILFIVYAVVSWAVGEQQVQDWISEQFDSIMRFIYDIAGRITGGL